MRARILGAAIHTAISDDPLPLTIAAARIEDVDPRITSSRLITVRVPTEGDLHLIAIAGGQTPLDIIKLIIEHRMVPASVQCLIAYHTIIQKWATIVRALKKRYPIAALGTLTAKPHLFPYVSPIGQDFALRLAPCDDAMRFRHGTYALAVSDSGQEIEPF